MRNLPEKACQSAPILIGVVEEIGTIFCANTFRKEHRRPGLTTVPNARWKPGSTTGAQGAGLAYPSRDLSRHRANLDPSLLRRSLEFSLEPHPSKGFNFQPPLTRWPGLDSSDGTMRGTGKTGTQVPASRRSERVHVMLPVGCAVHLPTVGRDQRNPTTYGLTPSALQASCPTDGDSRRARSPDDATDNVYVLKGFR
jgi:hypothetical protein